MGLGTPQICLGYLSSEDIYGNDVDVPLYYFNIVQDKDYLVKVVITTSKSGAVGAAYYQAVRGFSTDGDLRHLSKNLEKMSRSRLHRLLQEGSQCDGGE